MKELTTAEVVRQAMESGKSENISTEDINEVVKIYNSIKFDKTNINKSKEEKLENVNSITIQLLRAKEKGKTSEDVARYHSDNKHMYYFDMVLEKGASSDIEKALAKNKLGTDLLSGIKYNQKYENTINGLYIEQKTNKDIDPDDDDSIYVAEFRLIYKGKTIYEFVKGEKGTLLSQWEINKLEEKGLEVKPTTANQKEDSIDKLYAKIITPDGNEFKEYKRKTKTGKKQTIIRDRFGRFVSKSDLEEFEE